MKDEDNKRICGDDLDLLIQAELDLMEIEGLEKAPIQASTLLKRLKDKNIVKGRLSTLSTDKRKKMIADARKRQHQASGLNLDEQELVENGRTGEAYRKKSERMEEQRDDWQAKYERNMLAMRDLIRYLDSATPIKVESLLASDLVRELAELERNRK